MLSTIAKPFGMLLMWLYNMVQNYGVAVILFALIVKLIMLPFMAKSKKSTMRTTRLTPKLKEIEKRHGANKQKYSEEVQKLYREEKINPMSGCLWSLLPFPILIALYEAIRYPITTMMGVASDLLKEGGALYELLYTKLGFSTELSTAYKQIAESQFITQSWAEHKEEFLAISDKITNIDWTFLGLDLGARPNWKFVSTADWSNMAETLPQLFLFLIPVIAAVLTYLQTKISMWMTKAPETAEEDKTQNQMESMAVTMPIMTLWFAYMMPAALGLYWIANTGFAIIQDIILTKIFKKQMDIEDAERLERDRQREAELEQKRIETERLRAVSGTEVNPNTSKKKQQRKEKSQQEAKANQWEDKHKKKKATAVTEDNPSRVGNRPYARGRAYDPNRFSAADYAEDDSQEYEKENAFESLNDTASEPEENEEVFETLSDEYEEDTESEEE